MAMLKEKSFLGCPVVSDKSWISEESVRILG